MDTKRAANFYGSFNYIFFIYANITLSDQSDSCSGCRSIVLSLLKIYLAADKTGRKNKKITTVAAISVILWVT